jgi:predicted metal-dependent phosphoesterase TrpH
MGPSEENMRKYIDLHMHSRYSDGDLTPAQLVDLAAYRGLNIIAKSDHDTARGYEEARAAGEKYRVIVLPGAEITTPNYHLLSLNFNPDDVEFRKFLEHSENLQKIACGIRLEILQEKGIPITLDKVIAEFPNSRLGKKNIFTAMMRDTECREYFEKYAGKTPREIFWNYFGKGGIASDLKDRPAVQPEEAIYAVHKAGGLIGLAHPPKEVKDMKELEVLAEQGIDFIEIQPLFREKYPYHLFEQWAKERGLPVTFGSDYHGPTMPREMLSMGDNILSDELEALLQKGYVKIPRLNSLEMAK